MRIPSAGTFDWVFLLFYAFLFFYLPERRKHIFGGGKYNGEKKRIPHTDTDARRGARAHTHTNTHINTHTTHIHHTHTHTHTQAPAPLILVHISEKQFYKEVHSYGIARSEEDVVLLEMVNIHVSEHRESLEGN